MLINPFSNKYVSMDIRDMVEY